MASPQKKQRVEAAAASGEAPRAALPSTPQRRFRLKAKTTSPQQSTEKKSRAPLAAQPSDEQQQQQQQRRTNPSSAVREALKAVHEVHKYYGSKGLVLLMLEPALPEDEDAEVPAAPVTKEALLHKDHLLLPNDLASHACGLCARLAASITDPGDQDCISAAWKILKEVELNALVHVRDKKFRVALGELLGLLLFAAQEDCWVTRKLNDTFKEWVGFCDFFEDISLAWWRVLSRKDEELGLILVEGAAGEGVAGGYRPRLLDMLRNWQRETNDVLSRFDRRRRIQDACSNLPTMARLCIIPEQEVKMFAIVGEPECRPKKLVRANVPEGELSGGSQ